MDDSEKTLSTLHRLKQLGVRIAMDDFGTGYSSLSYLRSFPFDKIKIDRTFVSDLTEGTEHAVIVQAVVSIARALGMTTTAEGVETAASSEFLDGARLRRSAGLSVQRAGPDREGAGRDRHLVDVRRRLRRERRRLVWRPSPRSRRRPPLRCRASCQSRNSPDATTIADPMMRPTSACRPRPRNRSPSPRPASGNRTATPRWPAPAAAPGSRHIAPAALATPLSTSMRRVERRRPCGSRTAAGRNGTTARVEHLPHQQRVGGFGCGHAAHRDGDAAVHHRIGEREQRAEL